MLKDVLVVAFLAVVGLLFLHGLWGLIRALALRLLNPTHVFGGPDEPSWEPLTIRCGFMGRLWDTWSSSPVRRLVVEADRVYLKEPRGMDALYRTLDLGAADEHVITARRLGRRIDIVFDEPSRGFDPYHHRVHVWVSPNAAERLLAALRARPVSEDRAKRSGMSGPPT